MKVFIKKILFYFLLLFSIIGFFYFINSFLIKKYKLLKIEHSKNILIIGASRTANAINDKILNHSINLSGAGDPLFYSLVKLKTLKINNSNIDTVLLSLDNRTIDSKYANHFYRPLSIESKLPNYYNFLSLNDFKRIYNISKFSTLKPLFEIPKYTLKLIKNIISKPHEIKSLNIGGNLEVKHVINQKIIDHFLKNDSLKNYTLSKIEIENLNRIAEFCKSNKIELIFINPPIHPVMYNSLQYQEGKIIFDGFLKRTYPNHTYFDFSFDFLPDSCYADLIHLNEKGAKRFSKRLDQILKIYNKNPSQTH